MKKELKEIKQQEKKLEHTMENDLELINKNLIKDKSILDNIWKTEIVAGFVGALIVFILLAVYYSWNGLIKNKKIAKNNDDSKYFIF